MIPKPSSSKGSQSNICLRMTADMAGNYLRNVRAWGPPLLLMNDELMNVKEGHVYLIRLS